MTNNEIKISIDKTTSMSTIAQISSSIFIMLISMNSNLTEDSNHHKIENL